MKIENKTFKIIAFTFILLISLQFVIGANDPGHDTLYIEQTGDSELTGSFNVSGNLSAESVIFSGVDLDIRGDGATDDQSNNQISGSASAMFIQSLGHIYINTLTGTTSMVYLGDGADSVSLNITGALYVKDGTATIGGQGICLANGTNCPVGGTTPDQNNYTTGISITGTTTKNITMTITGRPDLSVNFTDLNTGNTYSADNATLTLTGSQFTFNDTWGNETYVRRGTWTDIDSYPAACAAGQFVTTIGDTLTCSAVTNGSATNATYSADNATLTLTATTFTFNESYGNNTYLNDDGDNATGNYTFGSGVLHIDDTNDFVGVGTATPISSLDVKVASSDHLYINQAETLPNAISLSSYNETGTENRGMEFTASAFLFNIGNVGIGYGMTTPTAKLHVNGSINATSGNDICIDGGNCLSSVTGSGGGITSNAATAGYIPQFQNTSGGINNSIIFQNGTKIGIGTATPTAYLQIKGNASTVGVNGHLLIEDTDVPYNYYLTTSSENFAVVDGIVDEIRLLIDKTGSIGIGDDSPEATLDVQNASNANQFRVSYDDSNFGNISVNSGGNMTIKATGHVIIDLS